ncbi:MAG: hypothetical protein IT270_00480 [Saprospiraceae bacterium]|nr:hypothetical protein [Saprospiraceae bacterium]
MIFKINYLFAFGLGIIAFFSSCKAEDETPGIIIVSPINGDSQQAEMVIEVYFSDAEGLKEARIEVTKDSDGSVYFEDMPLVNDSTGVLYTKVIPITNLDVFTPLTMQVDVRDKSDQYLLTKVRFTAKK